MSSYIEISGSSRKASVEEAFHTQIDAKLITVQDEIDRLRLEVENASEDNKQVLENELADKREEEADLQSLQSEFLLVPSLPRCNAYSNNNFLKTTMLL